METQNTLTLAILQRGHAGPYIFIICLDYVLRTSIDDKSREWLRTDEEKKQDTPQQQLPTPTTPMT